MNLINQPTLRPTRKMAAVGWTSLLGPIAAAIIAPWLSGRVEEQALGQRPAVGRSERPSWQAVSRSRRGP